MYILARLKKSQWLTDGRSALPMELWTNIFYHLDDDGLLAMAAVCRPFNDLCTVIHLLTNGVTRQGIDVGQLQVQARSLAALQRAFFLPPIRLICCTFRRPNVSQQLRILGDIISRSDTSLEVEIQFVDRVFEPNVAITEALVDPTIPPNAEAEVETPVDKEDPTVHSAFQSVIHAMAARNGGRIICLDPIFLSACKAGGVSQHLKVRYSVPSGTVFKGRSLFAGPDSLLKSGPREATRHYIIPLSSFTSIRLRSLRSRSTGSKPRTMIMLQRANWAITQLTIGWAHSSLSDGDLAIMLPHLTLPSLNTLQIFGSAIPPTILSQFLVRHGKLQRVTADLSHKSVRSIISPPVELPELHHLRGETTASLAGLLDGIKISKPCTLAFMFTRRSEYQWHTQKALLQKIAGHSTNITLELFLGSSITDLDLDATDIEIAGSLKCVETVQVTTIGIQDIWIIVPWLQALPMLSTLKVKPLGRETGMDDLLQELRSTLPQNGLRVCKI